MSQEFGRVTNGLLCQLAAKEVPGLGRGMPAAVRAARDNGTLKGGMETGPLVKGLY